MDMEAHYLNIYTSLISNIYNLEFMILHMMMRHFKVHFDLFNVHLEFADRHVTTGWVR